LANSKTVHVVFVNPELQPTQMESFSFDVKGAKNFSPKIQGLMMTNFYHKHHDKTTEHFGDVTISQDTKVIIALEIKDK